MNNLWKHGGKRQALILLFKVYKVGEYYMNKDFFHAENEHLFVTPKKDTIVISSKFAMLLLERRKKNWSNFLFVFTC
jgi:hypothetical protein